MESSNVVYMHGIHVAYGVILYIRGMCIVYTRAPMCHTGMDELGRILGLFGHSFRWIVG